MTSRSSGTSRGPGPSRYQRSSTASMTQLLSDSCSSLLHRLTSRVRGPSATVESPSASSRAAGMSLSSLGLGPLGLGPPWSQAAPAAAAPATGPDRDKDRERARDRVRATSPTFTTFGQTRSRLEKKYGQKKTSPPPSPATRRSTQRSQRSRQSKPRAGGAASTPTHTPTRTPSLRSAAPASAAAAAAPSRKEPSPLLGVSKVRHTDHYGARTAASPAAELGSTRSRLEDKYSAILAKYGREPRERDKDRDRDRPAGAVADTRSPHPLPLSKSATTSIVLSEKAYPYVSGASREKTPYRHGERERRSRQRSGHRLAAPRLCAVEFDADAVDPVPPAPSSSRPMSPGEREAIRLVAQEEARERERALARERERGLEERTLSPVTSEREARRKEIQSLIAKYTTAVNDRLQRREQREKERAENAASVTPAAGAGAGASRKAPNHAVKADSGTVTPTAGSGPSRATTMVAHPSPALGSASSLGHAAALGHGLGLGPGHGHGYGLGYGPGYGPGHGLGKSASGVFPSTHSDSGAIYKSQQKYSSLLNRRPNVSSSATSLALPNFSFVRSVHGALTAPPRPAPPRTTPH